MGEMGKLWKGEKVKRYMLYICALAVFAAGAATIDCGDSELSLDELGRIAGLRDRETGRELVAKSLPMFVVRLRDGREVTPSSCREVLAGRFEYVFPNSVGTVVLECRPFFGGWTFEIASAALAKSAQSVSFGNVAPRCAKYLGKQVPRGGRFQGPRRGFRVFPRLLLFRALALSALTIRTGSSVVLPSMY